MVRGEMWVGTAGHLTLASPLHTHRAHEAQRHQEIRTVENVVNDALEIVRVVCVVHLPAVGPPEVELMDQLGFPGRGPDPTANGCAETLQESVVPMTLEVGMAGGDAASTQVLHHAGIG